MGFPVKHKALKELTQMLTYTNKDNSYTSTLSTKSYDTAIELLRAVHGDNDICFQTFDDGAKTKGTKDSSLVANWHGSTDSRTMKRLMDLNSRGAGIYHTVNHTDGTGRTAANITGVTSFFCDYDGCEPKNLDQLPLPSAIVQSKNGKHLYWFLQPEACPIERFTAYQQLLINLTGGDEVVKDLPRVMRLPGFNHMKNPSDPYAVQLLELHSDRRYTLSDFPFTTLVAPTAKVKTAKTTSTNIVGTVTELLDTIQVYQDTVAVQKLTSKQVEGLVKRCKAKLATGSRNAGTANNRALETGIIASKLVLTGTWSVEEAREALQEWAQDAYGSEVKADGTAWNTEEYKVVLLRGLNYGAKSSLEQLKQSHYPLTDAITTSKQFVADMGIDLDAAKLTVIQSPIGTGKTWYVKECIRQAKQLDSNNNTYVRIVCHRVALVEQWYDALKDEGFVKYSDLNGVRAFKGDELGSVRFLICTYDSLALSFNGWHTTKELLVLDEIDQALQYTFLSKETSIAAKRNKCYDILKVLVQSATHIIATSATVSDTEVDILTEMAKSDKYPELTVQKYLNMVKPHTKTFVQLGTEDVAYSTIASLVSEGKKVYVATDSRVKAEAIAAKMQILNPDVPVACITSKTKDTYDLGDINSTVQRYQLVVASPTVGTGVDISCEYFDSVVGVFVNSRDLTFKDCLQSVGRVRYPLDKVYVYIDDNSNALLDVDRLAERHNLGTEAIQPFVLGHELEMRGTSRKLKELLHQDYYSIQEYQMVYLLQQEQGKEFRGSKFWSAVQSSGHTIELLTQEIPVSVRKHDIKEQQKQLKVAEAEAIATAPVFNKEQVAAVKKLAKSRKQGITVTKTDLLAVERYFISLAMYPSQSGQADVTADEVLWYNKRGKYTIAATKLLKTDMYNLLRDDVVIASRNEQDGGYDGKFYARNKQSLERLLAALQPVLDAGKFTKYDLSGFMAVVRDIGVETVRQLGVRVDMKDASGTAKSLLELMEYTVNSKQVRVCTTNLDMTSKEVEGVSGTTKERQYIVTRTTQQSILMSRLLS